jgi:ferric-dicitrate binding protein FerR (iron transport regulator)
MAMAARVARAARQAGGGDLGTNHALSTSGERRSRPLAGGSGIVMELRALIRLAISMDTLT